MPLDLRLVGLAQEEPGVEEARIGKDEPRAGAPQDLVDLRPREATVQRDEDRAEAGRRERRLEVLEPVPGEDRDAVATGDAAGAERARERADTAG